MRSRGAGAFRLVRIAGFLTVPSVPVPAGAQQYDLQVRMLPAAHRMIVSGSVELPAESAERPSIALRLATTMGGLRMEILAPKVAAGPATLTPTVTRDVTTWRVAPANGGSFPAERPVRLRFEYTGGEQQGLTGFHIGPDVAFAGGANIAWYPQVGSGRATGSLTFVTPAGLTLVAGGIADSATTDSGGVIQRITVSQPLHFSFVLGPFHVLRDPRANVPTAAYLLRVRPTSQGDLEHMGAVIDRLTTEFGDFPFPSYAMVEIPTEVAERARFSGISYPGFFALSSRLLDGPFNYSAYGHEISHAWWGVSIGFDGRAGGLYIQHEALAQYGALQVVEALAGPDAAERLRRTGHPGSATNHSGFGYLKLAAAGLDEPLSRLQPGRAGYVISDSKGFLVYDLLSQTVGRDTFRQALRDASRAHGFGVMTWPEFLGFITRAARSDLKWFFDQWFDRTGAPEWVLRWRQSGGTVDGTIEQPSEFYRLELEVELRSAACGRHTHLVSLRERITPFSLPAQCPVESVVADPRFRILHWEPSYRQQAHALAAATRADHLHQIGQAAAARAVYDSALAVLPQPDTLGVEFNLRYGLARLELSQERVEPARVQLEAATRAPSRWPPASLAFVYLELARLAQSRGDRAALERNVGQVIRIDQSVGYWTGASEEARGLLRER